MCLAPGEADFVLADKGYDSDAILRFIHEQGAIAVIPPRSNRKVQREYDRELYKQRNLIERAFNKLKHWRRIATRSTSGVTRPQLACIPIKRS